MRCQGKRFRVAKQCPMLYRIYLESRICVRLRRLIGQDVTWTQTNNVHLNEQDASLPTSPNDWYLDRTCMNGETRNSII